MSAATKQNAVSAFLAHIRAELADITTAVEHGLGHAAEFLGKVTPVIDKAAPLVELGLTATGNGAAAAGVAMGDKALDEANQIAQDAANGQLSAQDVAKAVDAGKAIVSAAGG